MSFLEMMEPLIHWIVFTKLAFGNWLRLCVGWGGVHQVSLAGTQIKELPSTKVPVLKVLWYLGSGENVRLEAE